ncbi:TIGR04211 family SH3 domain-containing protein [Reinekea thalattae]|uniref:TIGR04211 family SH3 domain-containing protein n=1 Tax=Reinekea thalattae TaxID=2593301 RepID=A0A5C8Z4D7_9GAMM|nr:TIGR04211 family SH3 domain-containing protein [Reinekea thalattae]TXR52119.1 TIGR04211 family SH3 domain-containing protein [Reinekea thalattae]
MPSRSVVKLLLVFSLFSAPIATFAETAWLSDVLWVSIRSEPSSSGRVLKVIQSGTRMEVLEAPDGSSYSRVRTDAGLEGWIPRRYLASEQTSALKIANIEAEKNQLQNQIEDLEKKYSDLLTDKGDVNGEILTLRTDNAELTKELNRIRAISSDAIDLDARIQEVSEENANLKNENDVLKAENQSLREYNDNQWLLAGGGLIILGIILGVILPRVAGKKRRDSWS